MLPEDSLLQEIPPHLGLLGYSFLKVQKSSFKSFNAHLSINNNVHIFRMLSMNSQTSEHIRRSNDFSRQLYARYKAHFPVDRIARP